jgi:hypothetical protein
MTTIDISNDTLIATDEEWKLWTEFIETNKDIVDSLEGGLNLMYEEFFLAGYRLGKKAK